MQPLIFAILFMFNSGAELGVNKARKTQAAAKEEAASPPKGYPLCDFFGAGVAREKVDSSTRLLLKDKRYEHLVRRFFKDRPIKTSNDKVVARAARSSNIPFVVAKRLKGGDHTMASIKGYSLDRLIAGTHAAALAFGKTAAKQKLFEPKLIEKQVGQVPAESLPTLVSGYAMSKALTQLEVQPGSSTRTLNPSNFIKFDSLPKGFHEPVKNLLKTHFQNSGLEDCPRGRSTACQRKLGEISKSCGLRKEA